MKWIKENKLLLLILFVGAVLRFYKVDFQSLWIDEVLSMNDANPATTLSETNKSVLFWEAMPPLYFVILKYILTLFGYTTLIARLLSAVIGVVGIYAMYLLGKEMYNKRCGLLCASIVCIYFSYFLLTRSKTLWFSISFYDTCLLSTYYFY